MEENFVIGLDCGASHTTVSVWNNGKKIFHKSDLPGMNPDVVSSTEAMERLVPLIKELSVYRNAKWVVGMAGIDNEEEKLEATKWLGDLLNSNGIVYSKYIVFSDIELVLWAGANNGAGIGLIAGTGSNCVGRNEYGEMYKTGGMSHLLSDEGSGFALGWKCLHLVAKMYDGRSLRTPLVEDVFSLYGCNDIVALKNLLVKSENMKVDVARCAKTLLAASDRGEDEAMKICAEESLELVRMVAAVNSGLRSEGQIPVFLSGSVFQNNNYLDLFKSGLEKFAPGQSISLVTPIDGALEFANSVA